MSSRLFLVTAAVGATGSETVRGLLSKGYRVRAFVRHVDGRSDALKSLGAEVVQGDLFNFASVRSAMEGVHAAYFCFPIVPGILTATAYFAQAALEAKVSFIVNMSQMSAVREATSHAALDHWIGERVFDRSGVPVTHIRPGFFAEWLFYYKAMLHNGTVSLPFTTGVHAPIAAEDQARVIVALLDNPAPHIGKVYPLSGPVLMTFEEMFRIAGSELDKPIQYRVIDMDEYGAMWSAMGLSEFFVQHIVEVAKAHINGGFSILNNEVERITGQKPLTVAEFVQKNRAQLLDKAPAKQRNVAA